MTTADLTLLSTSILQQTSGVHVQTCPIDLAPRVRKLLSVTLLQRFTDSSLRHEFDHPGTSDLSDLSDLSDSSNGRLWDQTQGWEGSLASLQWHGLKSESRNKGKLSKARSAWEGESSAVGGPLSWWNIFLAATNETHGNLRQLTSGWKCHEVTQCHNFLQAFLHVFTIHPGFDEWLISLWWQACGLCAAWSRCGTFVGKSHIRQQSNIDGHCLVLHQEVVKLYWCFLIIGGWPEKSS